MSVKGDFGRLLKSLRIRSEIPWTQESLAEALREAGCKAATRTYKSWEKGEHIPPAEVLKHIVVQLGLNKEDADALYRAAAQAPPNVELDSSAEAQTSSRIHNIPFPRNPFFTGREAQLERIKQFLKGNGTVAVSQPISISGLGGIGKTQLALEYAHRSYPNVYRAVFWVNAANKALLQHNYVSLAQLLQLPEQYEDNVEQQVQAVKRWLEWHTNWLLILDNADDLQLARPYLPVKPGGHILLTTRSQIVGTIGRRIEIEEMEPAEGLLFLLRRSGLVKDETEIATIASDVREEAARLVKMLGSHPLALDQAGAYIEETGATFAGYIKLYKEARHSLLDRRGSSGSSDGDHPETVVTTLELCFRKACEEHPLAEAVLYLCAIMPTTDAFFTGAMKTSELRPTAKGNDFYPHHPSHRNASTNEEYSPIYASEFILQGSSFPALDTNTLNEVAAVLRRYSLVKRNYLNDRSLLTMHPLVQTIFRGIISPDFEKHLMCVKGANEVIYVGEIDFVDLGYSRIPVTEIFTIR